jgi:D-sedoheptulose 7-phosphate isomerase
VGTTVNPYLLEVSEIIDRIPRFTCDSMVGYLSRLRDREGRLFIIGNGGGAGHASHAAADFRKIAHIETYAWGENVSDLTAYTNDHGWAASTSSWLADSNCGKKDAVMVFSVGGASREVSQNLKEAVFWAKGGPAVLGIVGQNGGYVALHADCCIIIPSLSTPHVESIQAVLWHGLVTALAR